MMQLIYREQLPALALQPFIECFWSLRAKAGFSNVILPDGCVDLVYSRQLGLQVAGPMTRPQYVWTNANSCTFGMRFRPGMASAFIGIPTVEIRDKIAEARVLFPKRANQVDACLAEANDDSQAFRIFSELFPRTPPTLDGFTKSIRALTTSKGLQRIDELVHRGHLSARQFRRRCLAESGYSPKHLSRLLRFREARRLSLQQRKPMWADIAVQAGYFDQAHLIRDFIEFAGAAPSMAVLSNT